MCIRDRFRFQVMLLSSDIGGARMCIKVAPTDPQLASNPKLCVQSHSFASRARMPDEYGAGRAKRTAAASHLLGMAEAEHSPAPAPERIENVTRVASPNKRQCASG